MLSWPNLNCYVYWKVCDRKISRPIGSNMWILTDEWCWCHELIWCVLWIGTYSVIMLSWPNLKCYVDWNVCDRKLPWPIWSNIWIRSIDKGWCHDLTLRSNVDMNWWHRMMYWPNIYIAMWIGKDVRGSFQEQF
jgi:hypothetical protein